MRTRVCLVTLLALFVSSERAFAQGWNADARKLALGGVGTTRNIASEMIEPDPRYRAIFVPLGLIQLIANRDKFDPTSNDFDPVRAMEYVANPYHFTVGRNDESAGRTLVKDLFNGNVQTNLDAYRGFIPPRNPRAEGIASFDLIHKTFRIPTGGTTFQGIYVGLGPYFTHRTSVEIDQKILDILSGAASASSFPNSEYSVLVDRTTSQLAAALTFGYRAHMGLPAGIPATGTDREGVYVAVNYSVLRGFLLEDAGLKVRFDTDGAGNLLLDPFKALSPCPLTSAFTGGPAVFGTPLCTDRRHAGASSIFGGGGWGRAIDFGVATVFGAWELGFGVNGVSNYIEWDDVSRTSYGLGANVKLTPAGPGDPTFEFKDTDLGKEPKPVKIEQPKDVRADATYHASFGTVMAEIRNGYQGTSFHSGIERKFGPLFARGGMRRTNEKWNPSVGAGINIFPRVGLDFAYLTSTANAEKERQSVMAVSIRINAGS